MELSGITSHLFLWPTTSNYQDGPELMHYRVFTLKLFCCSKQYPIQVVHMDLKSDPYSQPITFLGFRHIRVHAPGATESATVRNDFSCMICSSPLKEDVKFRVLGGQSDASE